MDKGDIVLVHFPFSNLKRTKKRPALILFDTADDVTLCFITTQFKWQSQFDFDISPSSINGLKKTSLVKLTKIATIEKSLIIGLLGKLDSQLMNILDLNLIKILKLNCA
jgi:mRNA interferase MazF